MGCRQCGAPTSRRLCRDCERDERWEDRAEEVLREEREADEEATTDGGWSVDQQGLDGESHDGQATLDGGVAKDGGDH